jgi:hypothetical protein
VNGELTAAGDSWQVNGLIYVQRHGRVCEHSVFRGTEPCSLVNRCQHFGGIPNTKEAVSSETSAVVMSR